jgi:Uma2 family endonuclease
MTLHLADGDIEVPLGDLSFEEFRRWTLSDDFPERGRFDYLRGRVEADVSPESLFSHNEPKGAIYATVRGHVLRSRIGRVFGDRARVVVESVGLSAEPDMVFISYETIRSRRVTLTPKEGRPTDAVEIVGPPDLAVEIVSDSSVGKDTRELYALYFEAGIREYWLIDVRGEDVSFRLLTRGTSDWIDAEADRDGFLPSPSLGHLFRLVRETDPEGLHFYDLQERLSP